MKRFISLVLVSLLLYNMVGYSVVFLTEKRHSISDNGTRFVQELNTGGIMLKIPVAIPYQNDWQAPEVAEGLIEHDGQFYQMISRQLKNDTLFVHCEYDQSARDRFSELVSQINKEVTGRAAGNSSDPHSSVLKHFLKEYMSLGSQHTFYVFEWMPAHVTGFPARPFVLPEKHFPIPSPPPDLA